MLDAEMWIRVDKTKSKKCYYHEYVVQHNLPMSHNPHGTHTVRSKLIYTSCTRDIQSPHNITSMKSDWEKRRVILIYKAGRWHLKAQMGEIIEYISDIYEAFFDLHLAWHFTAL